MKKYLTNVLRIQIGTYLDNIAKNPIQRFKMKDIDGMLPPGVQKALDAQWRRAEEDFDTVEFRRRAIAGRHDMGRAEGRLYAMKQMVGWAAAEQEDYKEKLLLAADVLARGVIVKWLGEVTDDDKEFYEIRHTPEDLDNLVGLRDKMPRLQDTEEYLPSKKDKLHELIMEVLRTEHERLLRQEAGLGDATEAEAP